MSNRRSLDTNASPIEDDFALGQGEEGIISSNADIFSRLEMGAPLAHDNGARFDLLAAIGLNAPVLGIAVAAITGRTLSFFMSHVFTSFFCPLLYPREPGWSLNLMLPHDPITVAIKQYPVLGVLDIAGDLVF